MTRPHLRHRGVVEAEAPFDLGGGQQFCLHGGLEPVGEAMGHGQDDGVGSRGVNVDGLQRRRVEIQGARGSFDLEFRQRLLQRASLAEVNAAAFVAQRDDAMAIDFQAQPRVLHHLGGQLDPWRRVRDAGQSHPRQYQLRETHYPDVPAVAAFGEPGVRQAGGGGGETGRVGRRDVPVLGGPPRPGGLEAHVGGVVACRELGLAVGRMVADGQEDLLALPKPRVKLRPRLGFQIAVASDADRTACRRCRLSAPARSRGKA